MPEGDTKSNHWLYYLPKPLPLMEATYGCRAVVDVSHITGVVLPGYLE